MKKLLVLLTVSTVLTGCALTDYAADYFKRSQQLNTYEEALDLDSMLCDPKILAQLQNTRSKEWFAVTVADCQKRKVKNVPLAN